MSLDQQKKSIAQFLKVLRDCYPNYKPTQEAWTDTLRAFGPALLQLHPKTIIRGLEAILEVNGDHFPTLPQMLSVLKPISAKLYKQETLEFRRSEATNLLPASTTEKATLTREQFERECIEASKEGFAGWTEEAELKVYSMAVRMCEVFGCDRESVLEDPSDVAGSFLRALKGSGVLPPRAILCMAGISKLVKNSPTPMMLGCYASGEDIRTTYPGELFLDYQPKEDVAPSATALRFEKWAQEMEKENEYYTNHPEDRPPDLNEKRFARLRQMMA
jgi:hypothetical protein